MKLSTRAVIVSLGLIFLFSRNPSAHEPILEQIRRTTLSIAEHPEDASLYVRRGELHRVHEDWSRALDDYASAVEIDRSVEHRVDLLRGILFFQSGRADEALAPLDRFLSRSPQHLEARITRARVRARLGRTKLAIDDFDEALALPDGHKPGIYIERAKTVRSLGEAFAKDAVLGLDEGIDALGPIVTLLLTAIELETAMGHFDSALTRMDQILAQASRKEGWLYRRGEILEQAGRDEEAVEACEQALSLIDAQQRSRRTSARTSLLESKIRATLAHLAAIP